MKKWRAGLGPVHVGAVVQQGPSGRDAGGRADALVTEFVYRSLALAPVAASTAGYHVHESVRLDGLWDDYSAAGLDKLRQFNRQVLHRLDALQHARLDAERLADLDVIRDAVNLKLLELDEHPGLPPQPDACTSN